MIACFFVKLAALRLPGRKVGGLYASDDASALTGRQGDEHRRLRVRVPSAAAPFCTSGGFRVWRA